MKITLNNISTQNSVPTASATINNNNDAIETALENTLSRDGTSPNQMGANIDVNSHRILNLPAPVTADEPLRYQDLSTFVGGGTVTNIPAGGNTNEVMTKISNADYAVAWVPSSPGVVTAGTNIAITGTSPATVSTVQNPNFTTSVTTPSLVLNGTTLNSKTGTGAIVLANTPTLIAPLLGTPTSGVATNLTGTASGLTAGTVTTNANLTGDVTSVGNSTTLTNAPVIAKVLTGYTSGAGTVSATDSILSAIQKLNGNDATNANLTGPITSVGNATTIAASPALTGTPTTPTAAVDTNTTQIASTAFVLAQAGSATPLIDGSATVGTSTRFARQDHIHPTDTTRAALASPTFTGTPAAPTAAVDTNTTQLATTAMVLAQAASATPLIDGVATVGTSTRYARADHVHPTDTTKVATVKKQVFTSSGTYTPSAGMLYCVVECVGGGGGGGTGYNTSGTTSLWTGGGGGAGGYSRSVLTAATIGASKAIVIGTAGTGGAAGGANNGLAGGDTTLNTTTVVAKGGSGGGFTQSGVQVGAGGAGGIAGTGDLTTVGGAGITGIYGNGIGAVFYSGGSGGSSYFGGGGVSAGGVGVSSTGTTATGYGGGGSGGVSSASASGFGGGNGMTGVMFITEYCSQ